MEGMNGRLKVWPSNASLASTSLALRQFQFRQRRLPRCSSGKPPRRLSMRRQADVGTSNPKSLSSSLSKEESHFKKLYTSMFGTGYERDLGPEVTAQIQQLPGTRDYFDYMTRMASVVKWKQCLQKGIFPRENEVTWPAEPFKTKFTVAYTTFEKAHRDALQRIEMLGFTRRYPRLLTTLLKQMLELAHTFEEALLDIENKSTTKQPHTIDGHPSQNTSPSQEQGQNSNAQIDNVSSEALQHEDASQDLEVTLKPFIGKSDNEPDETDSTDTKMAEMERIAEEIVERFEEEMEPVMDSLKKASEAFHDLDDLLDEEKGFDLNSGLWKRTGWHEMEKLKRKLEDLRELRDLVRKLGRSGGRGPKRRAPVQIYKSSCPPGVVRSALQPEETSGLCRSGDLSRMLPCESALMAAGWPQNEDKHDVADEKHQQVSKAARLLHLARRAERNLLSYERSGWLDDEPSVVLPQLEYRPAEEQGPIIICLDTSGSMKGVRETVAKAVVLECLRGSHKQNRKCYLYAFSSYADIKELELTVDVHSLPKLLDFLEHSFEGGTNVTQALELSIERVKSREWARADILIVTDGEMALPDAHVLKDMETVRLNLGLEVHGLLVGNTHSDTMKHLCSQLHVFQSWDIARSTKHE